MRASRGATGPLIIALFLAGSRHVVGSQSPSGAVLVDVPIPLYPPIAQAARVSGDVRVTVDVRPDGTVASAAVEEATGPALKLLDGPALAGARGARFRCEGCADGTRPYTLVFAFRFAGAIGRLPGDVDPEIINISPSQSRILIVADDVDVSDGPAAARPPARVARCLWLWRCESPDRSDEDEAADPELRLVQFTAPAYPANAHTGMASADVEVKLAVRRDGRIQSAEIGVTRELAGSTPEILSAFQAAALGAARESRFVCIRCGRASLLYSITYRFRFDGVLARFDPGRSFAGLAPSSTQMIVPVNADAPALHAALSFRADTLPSACRLAPAKPADFDLPLTSNPWSSDEKPWMSRIRERVTGHLDRDPASRYELQLAEGVRQAYVGRYTDGAGGTSVVYGLLFGDRNDARAFVELARKPGSTTFLAHRQIVVVVRGDNACANALARGLKERAQTKEGE